LLLCVNKFNKRLNRVGCLRTDAKGKTHSRTRASDYSRRASTSNTHTAQRLRQLPTILPGTGYSSKGVLVLVAI
jgi:hypothetical protein